MRKFLIGIGIVLVLVVVALFVGPGFIPSDTYRSLMSEYVEEATGRKLTIKGEVSLSLLPTPSVKMNDVAFANPPGASTPHMATFKRLEIELEIMPLISGRYEISGFRLVEPVVNLEVDKSGRPNWSMEKAKATAKARAKAKAKQEATPKPAEKGDGSTQVDLDSVRFGDVKLVNGRITYLDRRTGARQRVDNVNLTVSMESLADPFKIRGDLVWNKQKVNIDFLVQRPDQASGPKGSPMRLSLNSKPLVLNLVGVAKTGKAPAIAGKLDLDVPSVRGLAAWTGSPLQAKGGGLGPFKLGGQFSASPGRIALANAIIKLDRIDAKGTLVVLTSGAVPNVTGKLNVAMLDLNPYLGGSGAAGGGKASSGGGGGKARGAARSSGGWSRERIDTAALRGLNADLTMSAGGIRYKKIKIGSSQLRVRLAGGRLQADLQRLDLYSGKGRGVIVIDGRGRVPAVSQSFTLTGLAAKPFLSDAANYNGLSGLGSGTFKFAGRGISQYAIVNSLNGGGTFTFKNGAIRGASIITMVCSINPAQLMKGVGGNKETRFSHFAGKYTIRNGVLTVARYEDMKMLSPLLRLQSKGNSRLAPRTLDFRVEPKVVGTCKGQGGGFQRKGLAVPLLIKGTWDNPRWGLDMEALLKSKGADEIKKGVEGLIKGDKKSPKKVREGIKSIFGIGGKKN